MHKNEKDKLILGLDIGTIFVKAILARILPDDSIEILSAAHARQNSGAMRAGVILDIPSVISTCEKAISSVEKSAGVKASDVVVGIAGEQLKCSTSTIHYTRESKNLSINESEMSVVLDKVKFETGKRAQSEIAIELDNPLAEISLINSSIISIIIDGQKVNNPIGFKGSNLEIEFYTAFAPKSYISAIEKICSELELNLISSSADPYSICRALIGAGDSLEHPAIIVDVGGTNTNLAIIDTEGIRGTSTFSMGNNIIESNISIWMDSLNIALSEFKKIENYPSRILLCGGGAKNEDLGERLALDDWYSDLNFKKRPLVSIIDISTLPGIKNEKINLDADFVSCIGLIHIGLDENRQNSDSPKLSSLIRNILKK